MCSCCSTCVCLSTFLSVRRALVRACGRHSLWFRSFFREYLPEASEHTGKNKKMKNCGYVSTTCCGKDLCWQHCRLLRCAAPVATTKDGRPCVGPFDADRRHVLVRTTSPYYTSPAVPPLRPSISCIFSAPFSSLSLLLFKKLVFWAKKTPAMKASQTIALIVPALHACMRSHGCLFFIRASAGLLCSAVLDLTQCRQAYPQTHHVQWPGNVQVAT